MPSILPSLQALRQAAVTAGDGQWDQAEVQQLTKLARTGGDEFTLAPAAKSFLTCELHGKATFAPGARQTLTDMLAAQGATSSALAGPRHEAYLAVQEGSSNKFYTMVVEGSTLTTRWGPIGKEGQSKAEAFATPAEADLAFVKGLRGKLAKGYTAADPEALGLLAPSTLPTAAKGGLSDLATFHALSHAAQDEILDWAGSATKAGLTTTGSVELSALTDPTHKAFAQALRDAAAEATGDFEVHDDEYLRVGEPRITVELYILPSGQLAGGEVHAFQQGVETPEDYGDVDYDDEQLQTLADATDVSWSVSGIYAAGKDGELRAVRAPDYMEWSGY
jgi:predicted DNA-binding WGR domain protein